MQPFVQALDTVGDGTGTKSSALDHSGPLVRYKIVPAASERLIIHSLSLTAEFAGAVLAYGPLAALTSGIHLRVETAGGAVHNITDPNLPIKRHGQLLRLTPHVFVPSSGLSGIVLSATLFFQEQYGHPLIVSGHQLAYLSALMNDNFTGLVSQTVTVSGVRG